MGSKTPGRGRPSRNADGAVGLGMAPAASFQETRRRARRPSRNEANVIGLVMAPAAAVEGMRRRQGAGGHEEWRRGRANRPQSSRSGRSRTGSGGNGARRGHGRSENRPIGLGVAPAAAVQRKMQRCGAGGLQEARSRRSVSGWPRRRRVVGIIQQRRARAGRRKWKRWFSRWLRRRRYSAGKGEGGGGHAADGDHYHGGWARAAIRRQQQRCRSGDGSGGGGPRGERD